MSKYNLAWLIIISSNLLMLQGCSALVNGIHKPDTTEARVQRRQSTVLANPGCGDQDCVQAMWRRNKRQNDDPVKPDNSVKPDGGSVKLGDKEPAPHESGNSDGDLKNPKDDSPKTNSSKPGEDSIKIVDGPAKLNDNDATPHDDLKNPKDDLPQTNSSKPVEGSVKIVNGTASLNDKESAPHTSENSDGDSKNPQDDSPETNSSKPAEDSVNTVDGSANAVDNSGKPQDAADNDDDEYEVWETEDDDSVLEQVTQVSKGQFPFIVAVQRLYAGEPTICTGTIFTESLVLFGASCIEEERDPRKYVVIAGISELSLASLADSQKRNVSQILLDNEENPRIAILKVKTPIVLNKMTKIRRISFERFLGWRVCTVINWGNRQKNSTTQWTLIKKDLQVYDNNKCREEFRNTTEGDLNRTVCTVLRGEPNSKPVCRGGSTVLFCDGVVAGFLKKRNLERCHLVKTTTIFTDLGSFANWTKNFAPKLVYNGLKLKTSIGRIGKEESGPTTRQNQSNNVHAIVFLAFSSAISLFIFA